MCELPPDCNSVEGVVEALEGIRVAACESIFQVTRRVSRSTNRWRGKQGLFPHRVCGYAQILASSFAQQSSLLFGVVDFTEGFFCLCQRKETTVWGSPTKRHQIKMRRVCEFESFPHACPSHPQVDPCSCPAGSRALTRMALSFEDTKGNPQL